MNSGTVFIFVFGSMLVVVGWWTRRRNWLLIGFGLGVVMTEGLLLIGLARHAVH